MKKIQLTSRLGIKTTLRVTDYVANRLQNQVEPNEWYIIDAIKEDINRWLDSRHDYNARPVFLTPSQCKRLYYFFGPDNFDYFHTAEVL